MNTVKSLYIHFPFCRHLCNYCDFFKKKFEGEVEVTTFEQLLEKQWIKHQDFLEEKMIKLCALDTLYIGGGTPSLWGKKGVDYIGKKLKRRDIVLNKGHEFTLEVDPDAWTYEDLISWKELGVNRVSVGAQAASDKYLKILDRNHELNQVKKLLEALNKLNFEFSVDLLIGVPNSKTRDISQEIDWLVKFNPSHFSVYILKTRKNYPLLKELPDDEQIATEYLKTCNYLESKGYKQYEVSNFAKNNMYSKHNKKYWKYESVSAIGPSSTGLLVTNDEVVRYQWKSSGPSFIEETLEGSSLLIEKIFLGLRNSAGLDLLAIFPNKLNELTELHEAWDKKNYLLPNSNINKVLLTSKGYLMCDSLMDDIFKEINF